MRIVLKTWLYLLVTVAIMALAASSPRFYRTALLGSGFMAHILCTGVFVSGRDPQHVLAEDLDGPGYTLLRYFRSEIDPDAKRVEASLLGFASETAIFRDGTGCTRLAGRSEDELRAQPHRLVSSPGTARLEAPWPEGERAEIGSLPVGADEAALTAAIEAAFSEPDPAHPRQTRALVVVHDGRIVAERYAEGFHAAMPLIGWSMSKTVTNALVGLRVKDGALAVSQDALLPEWRAQDDPRRAISLDEMLRMTSGLALNDHAHNEASDIVRMLFVVGDAAGYAAAKPLASPPATQWTYSSGATNIISQVLRESFDDERDYLRYAQERLFAPLGMRSAVLEPDASGTFVLSSLVYASARDWARLGLLFLRDGLWAGERLLPEGWVAYSLTPTALSPGGQYGAHIWVKLPPAPTYDGPSMPEDAYYMLGHNRQAVVIVPSRDLVIVRLGLTRKGADWHHARDLAPIVHAFPASDAVAAQQGIGAGGSARHSQLHSN